LGSRNFSGDDVPFDVLLDLRFAIGFSFAA
jgi:hypothetical protein